MAERFSGKPRVGKAALATATKKAAVDLAPVIPPASATVTSTVAIAAADGPALAPIAKRAAPKPAAATPALHKPDPVVTAPMAVDAAPKIAMPAPITPSAPVFETPAEAPAAPTPASPAVADPAPAAVPSAAIVAAAPSAAEPEHLPVADIKKEAIMDTVTNTVENTAAKAETMFADMNGRAKAAMEKTQKLAGEMGELHKGNVEAMVESAKIYAKGVEAMGQDAADYGRRSFEQLTAALKGMAQVKSPAELMKLHADYVRSSFDAAVAEGSKTTEAVIKLAGDVAQPMSSRFALVAEKVKAAA